MNTVQEFDDPNAFRIYLEELWQSPVDCIHFDLYGPDNRNGWEPTFLVTVDFCGITPGCPVGWSDNVFYD